MKKSYFSKKEIANNEKSMSTREKISIIARQGLVTAKCTLRSYRCWAVVGCKAEPQQATGLWM